MTASTGQNDIFHLHFTVAPLEPERVSVREFRPPSPSKQSLDSRVFESEKSMDPAQAQVISPRRPSHRSVESTEMKVRCQYIMDAKCNMYYRGPTASKFKHNRPELSTVSGVSTSGEALKPSRLDD